LARLTCWFGVNRSLFGYPPLVHAAAQGYAGVCGVLLRRGANVRAFTKKGLVRATEVASDKCHDWPHVRTVMEPYVKVRHIHAHIYKPAPHHHHITSRYALILTL
jgi:hypothetical protein